MMGDFDDATLFTCVVDQGSLVKAADALGVTPSVVSKRIARLESNLGIQLLKRTTRRQSLTEAGALFYQRVAVLKSDWEGALDEVKHLHGEPAGVLTIATPQPIASRFLMPVVSEFQRRYPNVAIQLWHRSLDCLPCYEADISICRDLPGYQSASMVVVPFYHYHNQLFASPAFLQTQSEMTVIGDLEQCPCLAFGGPGSHTQWVFQQVQCEPRVVFKTDNTEVLINAAVHNMGVIYVPEVIITEELKTGRLTPVLPEYKSQSYRTVAYYSKMDFKPAKIALFLELVKQFYEARS